MLTAMRRASLRVSSLATEQGGGNLRAVTCSTYECCSAADQSQNEQQDDRADEGIDDRSNKAATDYNADLREHPTSDQAADYTNDSRNPGGGKRRGNFADQSVAVAFNRHTGKPTGSGADDQPNHECLSVLHFFPQFSLPGKAATHENYSRFLRWTRAARSGEATSCSDHLVGAEDQ
jgi:hypothetical protein